MSEVLAAGAMTLLAITSVGLWTLRVALTARGRRAIGAAVAHEAVIFAVAFTNVAAHLDSPARVAGNHLPRRRTIRAGHPDLHRCRRHPPRRAHRLHTTGRPPVLLDRPAARHDPRLRAARRIPAEPGMTIELASPGVDHGDAGGARPSGRLAETRRSPRV